MSFFQALFNIHNAVFGFIQRITNDWLLGLFARFVFLAVLFQFFINSACTKVIGKCYEIDLGVSKLLFPKSLFLSDGAYIQIVKPIYEGAGYDSSAVPLHWKIVTALGTYTEFILPILIVIGLFTRLSALAMIGFIAVMTYVDIYIAGVEKSTIGELFNRLPYETVADQRVLWLMPLLLLMIIGPGKISLDYLIGRSFKK